MKRVRVFQEGNEWKLYAAKDGQKWCNAKRNKALRSWQHEPDMDGLRRSCKKQGQHLVEV